MKFISDESAARHHLAPKKNRCVWMEAGILSYLLCDREFDCDRCPLDEAMRSHFSGGVKARNAEAPAGPHPGAAGRIGEEQEAYHTADHLLVTMTADGTARLGIEPGLARVLPPVRSVVLPRPGQAITPAAFACWLVLDGGTLPLRLPVGGTVTGVNTALTERPHLLNTPEEGGEGWLFEFRPDDLQGLSKAFPDDAEAEEKYVRDIDNFRRLAAGCLHPGGSRARETLPDGGRFVEDLSTMIGPVKYLEIVRRAFGGVR